MGVEEGVSVAEEGGSEEENVRVKDGVDEAGDDIEDDGGGLPSEDAKDAVLEERE